jgi:hypothetical protein
MHPYKQSGRWQDVLNIGIKHYKLQHFEFHIAISAHYDILFAVNT